MKRYFSEDFVTIFSNARRIWEERRGKQFDFKATAFCVCVYDCKGYEYIFTVVCMYACMYDFFPCTLLDVSII